MRKQLIIKIPETVSIEEINVITNMITQSYTSGYPLFMFPGWEYEVVELSETTMIIDNSRNQHEEFIKKVRDLTRCTNNKRVISNE